MTRPSTRMSEPMKKPKKLAVINMRCRRADLKLLDQAARALGISRSALIRHAAEAHARRVLATTGANR